MFLFKEKSGFYYLYTIDPVSRKRSKISTRSKIKSEALKFLTNYKERPAQEITPAPNHSIAEIKEEALKTLKNDITIGTYKIYEASLRVFQKFTANKKAKLISVKDIESFKAFRLQTIKPATVNIEIRSLKAVFNVALRLGLISSNPFLKIKQISLNEKERLCFSDQQIKLLINNAPGHLRPFIILGLNSGARLNELIHLQWNDIDFEDMTMIIRNKEGQKFKTKSGKIRKIPINESAEALLRDLLSLEKGQYSLITDIRNPEKFILGKQNGFHFDKTYISVQFKKLCRSLNFDEKFHFHCLRHTFISNLVKANVNINHIRQLAGHSDFRTTLIYVHIDTEDLRNAVGKINFN